MRSLLVQSYGLDISRSRSNFVQYSAVGPSLVLGDAKSPIKVELKVMMLLCSCMSADVWFTSTVLAEIGMRLSSAQICILLCSLRWLKCGELFSHTTTIFAATIWAREEYAEGHGPERMLSRTH